jgi:cyclopropane fatty-acyl-phospholipid synthase-like methyltransferase
MNTVAGFNVEIDHIRKHYDRLSFLYRLFWGEHLHHGYWDADLSSAQAQVRLMERLAEQAHVPRGACVLDIGCGLGGSAFWLADRLKPGGVLAVCAWLRRDGPPMSKDE